MFRLTSSQALVFCLLYGSYALCLIIKRNYAFWKDDAVLDGVASAEMMGTLGALYESASGVSKVAGAVLVDVVSPTLVLAASLAAQGGSCLLLLALLQWRVPFALARGAWGVNGFVQAFAWPAAARVFLAWFPRPEDRGLWYVVLGTCQNTGAALAPLLTEGAAVAYGWRARLWLPGALAVLFSLLLLLALRAAPPQPPPPQQQLPAPLQPPQPLLLPDRAAGAAAVGSTPSRRPGRSPSPLPRHPKGQPTSPGPQHHASAAPSPPPTLSSLLLLVLTSRQQWLLSANYFFNSAVRNALTTHVVALLVVELKHAPAMAAAANAAFEVGGALGGLLAGALSDWAFGGRRGPVMLFFSLCLVPLPLALVHLQGAGAETVTAVYFCLGLAAFPPHVLNGLMSRELAPVAVQSTAGGCTKCWGQAGASLADYLVPVLVVWVGWERLAQGLALAAALSALAMVPLWGAVAEGAGEGEAGKVGQEGKGSLRRGQGGAAAAVAGTALRQRAGRGARAPGAAL